MNNTHWGPPEKKFGREEKRENRRGEHRGEYRGGEWVSLYKLLLRNEESRAHERVKTALPCGFAIITPSTRPDGTLVFKKLHQMSISLGMVNSRGAPSVTGSRRWLWYNKGRVVFLQLRIILKDRHPAACLQKNLPSTITHRNLTDNATKRKRIFTAGYS